jgi:D-glycero-D-manno-heptose 1,7-bisphosphate phosphatase
VIRGDKPASPRAQEEFEWEDGVMEAVHRLKEYGFPLVVVTNQPDIARGKMATGALEAMTARVYASLPIDLVCICPHDDIDRCACRKPKPGMLLDAATLLGIDCRRSFMVGDSWRDMEAGRAAGCKTILLVRPYNRGVACDYQVQRLDEAVELILSLCSPSNPLFETRLAGKGFIPSEIHTDHVLTAPPYEKSGTALFRIETGLHKKHAWKNSLSGRHIA